MTGELEREQAQLAGKSSGVQGLLHLRCYSPQGASAESTCRNRREEWGHERTGPREFP